MFPPQHKRTRRYGIERRQFLRYLAAVSAIPTIASRAEDQVGRKFV